MGLYISATGLVDNLGQHTVHGMRGTFFPLKRLYNSALCFKIVWKSDKSGILTLLKPIL